MYYFFIYFSRKLYKKMKLFLTTLLCVVSMCCFSQNEGFVIVEQDQRLDELIQRQKDIHTMDNTIDGFRIQIFMESGNDAVQHAELVTSEFKTKYPDIPIYLLFGQPYYRLRVGDFRTRLEAEKAFQEISKDYKKAFVVVSHDRMFLDNVANITYEIEYGKTERYIGNYSEFTLQKKIKKEQCA